MGRKVAADARGYSQQHLFGWLGFQAWLVYSSHTRLLAVCTCARSNQLNVKQEAVQSGRGHNRWCFFCSCIVVCFVWHTQCTQQLESYRSFFPLFARSYDRLTFAFVWWPQQHHCLLGRQQANIQAQGANCASAVNASTGHCSGPCSVSNRALNPCSAARPARTPARAWTRWSYRGSPSPT